MTTAARILVLALALLSLSPAGAAARAQPLDPTVPHAHRSDMPVRAPRRSSGEVHRPVITEATWNRHTVPTRTIRVHDGDTFYSGPETIRLRGIDTPELGQPKALAAKLRLIALLHDGPVTIVPRAEDVYGRIVADVYVHGRNVADILKSEGFEKPRWH